MTIKLVSSIAIALTIALSTSVVAHEPKKTLTRAATPATSTSTLSPEFKRQLFWNGWWQYSR